LVHFGVPGYSFHYLPPLIALAVLGIGTLGQTQSSNGIPNEGGFHPLDDQAPGRLIVVATLMAGLFLFYPTDYDRPGWRGSFDLSFARHTRIGLLTPTPKRQPAYWRTANSRLLADTQGPSAKNPSVR
jgi:hypothetical protein